MTRSQTIRLIGAGWSDRPAELASVLGRPIRSRRARPGPERLEARHAVLRGAAFLQREQRGDGSLRGFMLLPGASTSWITAHAAFVVESVPELAAFSYRAAWYLAGVVNARDGCGYNERVGEDLDSTSQALLVMHRFGMRIPAPALALIVGAQRPEGGFPTYPSHDPAGLPENGWRAPHPEVTALVVELLRRVGGFDAQRARAVAWLSQQGEADILPSYWWPGLGYGMWAQTRAGLVTPRTVQAATALLRARPSASFTSMALTAALQGPLDSPTLSTAREDLLAMQARDGSWPCEPCLRVTDPRCHQAGPLLPGRVVPDRRRVFSTVHAVAALSRATI